MNSVEKFMKEAQMKTDARVRYTRKVLRDALFDSLKTKSINQVTVKEVCEKAELNRATFYKHYRDCYDLIEQLQKEQLDEFEKIFVKNKEKIGTDLARDILNLLDKYSDLNEATVKGKVADEMKNSMIDIAREQSLEAWKRYMPKASDEEVEMLFTSVCAAIFQIAVCESGMHDKELIIEFVHSVISNSMRPYV